MTLCIFFWQRMASLGASGVLVEGVDAWWSDLKSLVLKMDKFDKIIHWGKWMFWGEIVIPEHLMLTFVTSCNFSGNKNLNLRPLQSVVDIKDVDVCALHEALAMMVNKKK